MAISMAELAKQLLTAKQPERYSEVMDRGPYSTGEPINIGYGAGDQMSPLDAAALITSPVPVVGDVTGLAADVDMYMRDPESRNIPNYILSAAGVVPFVPAASQIRKGIKAYHGSPHSFDRFSTEYIGTGEGAQEFGYGLYFAENEKVAKWYQDQLTANKDVGLHAGLNDELFEFFGRRTDDAAMDMMNDVSYSFMTGKPEPEEYKGAYEVLKNAGFEQPDPGGMYEVNIDVEPDELIDWFKPLNEQSEIVKKAFNFNPPPMPNYTAKDVIETGSSNPSYKYAVGQFPAAATAEEALRAANKPALMHTGPSGRAAYLEYEQALSDPISDPTGAITAAQNLQEKGVKGVRYADAFTRHKSPDKQSMNYVIFDDRLITIAKKYGVAIPVAAAMLARATGEDTSQSFQEET